MRLFAVSSKILDRRFVLLALVLSILSGCKKSETKSENVEQDALVARGKTVYMASCTACHNINPKLDGVLGPAVQGSSLELIEARVMYAKYPEGYQPKRATHAMIALPQLKNDIPALHAYLALP